jgi:hypothetical protein
VKDSGPHGGDVGGDLMQTLRRGLTGSKLLFAILHLAMAASGNYCASGASMQELKVSLRRIVAIRPIAIRC